MDLATFEALLAPRGQALLASLPPYDDSAVLALGERLRRDSPAALVASALTQSRLRARAVAKFGAAAAQMFFTAEGLEQATRAPVAERHAERFRAAGVRSVLDLCCGIGADARAMAASGLRVLAVDRDPTTAAVAAANLTPWPQAYVRCDDVTTMPLGGADGAFVDPARRSGRGRTFQPQAYSPPFSFVVELARRVAATGAKVAPGIPHALVPPGAQAQWVSVAGDVVEAGLWFGPLATPGVRRSALLLPGATGDPVEVSDRDGGGGQAPAGPLGRWLYEPDGAVVRAGLVAAVAADVDGRLADPTIAYVSADRLVATPLATAYEVLAALPFQLKRLRAVLRARDVGSVVVKKRGSAIEPEVLRRQLRLDGSGPSAIVVLTRVAGEPWALVTRRAG